MHITDRFMRRPVMRIALGAFAALVALAGLAVTQSSWAARRISFKDVKMIIEFNSSAEDVGVQFFLDANGWETVRVTG